MVANTVTLHEVSSLINRSGQIFVLSVNNCFGIWLFSMYDMYQKSVELFDRGIGDGCRNRTDCHYAPEIGDIQTPSIDIDRYS